MSIHWLFGLAAAIMLAAGSCGADSIDIKALGVKGDGKTDDSAAIQKALDQSAFLGGGTVRLPVGKYRLDNPIRIPQGVTLEGEWKAPHHADLDKGTVILVYAGKGKESDPALISLAQSSGVKGLTIFYPEQRVPGTVAYPWTIQGSGMHCSVQDVTLVNPYKGIDFGTHANELHYIRNVFGCPLKMGVFVDKCTDIGRIENVHFNPHYWMRCGAEGVPTWPGIIEYLFKNCTAFEFGRSDWEYVLNTFSYGCKIGMRFFASKDGPCNGNFLGNGIDWAETAILIEQTQEPGLLFTNGEFVGGKGAETEIEVTSSHTGVVQFMNCSFWGPSKRIARIAGGSASFVQCNFVNWDATLYAIEGIDGDLTVQNCRFSHGTNHVTLGPEVKTAVIMGNTMTAAPVKIDNRSKGDVQVLANVSRAK